MKRDVKKRCMILERDISKRNVFFYPRPVHEKKNAKTRVTAKRDVFERPLLHVSFLGLTCFFSRSLFVVTRVCSGS